MICFDPGRNARIRRLQSPLSGRALSQGGARFPNLLFLYRKTVNISRNFFGVTKTFSGGGGGGGRQKGYKGAKKSGDIFY